MARIAAEGGALRTSAVPPIYLVSAAGLPNYGDDFIARAWLDWLAAEHPDVDVWLDCVEPGRAAHLLDGVHPRMRTTNTLWQLSYLYGSDDNGAAEAEIRRLARERGTPRLDAGIELLHTARSIHFLGGGYLNEIWPRNLNMITAASEVSRCTGALLFATGQGFLPLSPQRASWLAGLVTEFDHIETRDAAGAQLLGIPHGTDDAFLGLEGDRRVEDDEDPPDVMVLLQGDFASVEERDSLVATAIAFVEEHAPDGRFGIVEALPPG